MTRQNLKVIPFLEKFENLAPKLVAIFEKLVFKNSL